MVRGIHHRRIALLGLAVVAYALTAWAVTPGFYDGIAPPAPYCWVSPPPGGSRNVCTQPPLSGHGTARVGTNGVVDPGNVFTQDGQASISFLPGSFTAPADRSPVTIQIKPQTTYPPPSGFVLATNVYCFTSSTPLVAGKDPLITLQFSTTFSAPTDVWEYDPATNGPWHKLGSTGTAAPFYLSTRAPTLGCFAGGFPPGTSAPPASSGSALPIIAGLAVAVVVLAGIPLLVLRRRGSGDEED